jgi:hypothetical protein
MVKLKLMIMKKIALMLTLIFGTQYVFAQDNNNDMANNSSEVKYKIYDVPQNRTPATVTRLGVAPQFTTLRKVKTKDDMYTKIKTLGSDPARGSEINNLFMGMGYSGGVNDPAFDADDLQQAQIPYGAMGMMGSRGNTYKYVILVPEGQTSIDAWEVKAANTGKDVYFFGACGNAFYYSNPPATAQAPQVIVKEKYVKDYSGYANVKVKVYARNKESEPCAWCGNCTDYTSETVLLSDEDISQIPVTREGTDVPVKSVYIDVDKKTFKKIKAKEENGEYKYKDESETASLQ